MVDVKKCIYLVVGLCFVIGAGSFNLWATDVAIQETSNLQTTQTPQEQNPLATEPRISFDAMSYDAGEVWEGDVVSHAFVVKNTGMSELIISGVRAG